MNPLDGLARHNCFDGYKIIKNKSLRPFVETVNEEQKREEIVNKVLSSKHKTEEVDDDALLVDSLVELKRKRFIDDKRRQQLRENNHDLIALEKQLRCAYISRGLHAQQEERERLRSQEKAARTQENELMEKARITFAENERNILELEHKKKKELREALQEQMEQTNMVKAKKYEEFLEEKKIVDEIVRKVYEEQIQMMRDKIANRAQLKAEMTEFLQAQEERRKQNLDNAEEENKLIEALIRMQQQRKFEAEEIKRKKLQRRADVSDFIGKKISAVAQEKNKRTEVLEDLLIEEKNAKNDEKFREKLEKEFRERMDTRMQLDMMKNCKEQQLINDLEEERLFREDLLKQLAERDKLDQLSKERKRRKQMEHRHAIEKTLDDRKKLRAEALTKLIVEREHDLKEEKRKQDLIEEERIKMLKEHAKVLLGYLPPGVLRESDREHLALPPKRSTQ